MNTNYPALPELLSAHGLTGAREEPLVHPGYSGASLATLSRADGERFVLKRMGIDRDWIMRATDDVACREAVVAASGIAFGERIAVPWVGVAHRDGGFALLMRDISAELLPQGPLAETQLTLVLQGMASLHALSLPDADVPWCDVSRRLLLLTPAGARIAATYRAGVAPHLVRGWELFARLAPKAIVKLIRDLSADPAPLIRALAPLPKALLHGDLKFDNIGLTPSRQLWLIDWAMPMLAPAAIELGWFLAINSRRLPVSLDDVMQRYADAAGVAPEQRSRHDAAAVLSGLLLRGWRKALDADEGEPDELHWWCERAEEARGVLDI